MKHYLMKCETFIEVYHRKVSQQKIFTICQIYYNMKFNWNRNRCKEYKLHA